ncbi:MAG TPA: carboxypeptidase-like regulatory domain-containing protein, partial [Vicinamibacteria bacterium]|nr:carboxypeptidase-like regulatory domain-containing protein [Vicinamibacteria bacterium]
MSRLLFSLGLLAALATTSSAGEIRGRVLVDGKPVRGVTVSALPFEDGFAAARREARREDLPKALATTVSRPDGAFAVVVAGPAGSALRLSFEGGPAAPRLLEQLFDSGGEDAGDVRLAKALALAGRVVDERGGPVVGATVTLWPGSGANLGRDVSPGAGVPRSATTRPDGTFRFDAAADEGNRLRVEAPAFATQERQPVRSGALARPLTLALGQVLRGTVTLADRRSPAAGALVRFEGRTQTTRWVEARADGTFLVEGAPREAGAAVADGGDRGRVSQPLTTGTGEALTLVLAPTATLAGRVVDADGGKPLAGIRLLARAEGEAAFLARSGADGRYAIRGLPPRTYRLSAEDERFVPWSRPVTVAAGQAETRDLPLARGATLAGRVVDEQGAPIEGARVQVTRGGENAIQAFMRSMEGEGAVRTGRDGSFRAGRLAAGEGQRLDVRHDEYEERAIGGISLTAGATRSGFTVVLRRGLSVRGVVKDEEGRPLAGAAVTLSGSRTLRAGRGGVQMSFIGPGNQVRRETGPDGRFEFRGLKSSDYTVAARRAGFAGATVDPVKVGETRAAEPLDLVLRPGVTVSGFLRDKTGSGASGWSVSARAAGQEGGMPLGPGAIRTEEPTGPDGSFLLEGLSAGEAYDLQVMGPSGLGPRKAGVVAPAEGVELTVTGAGQVRGRVVEAESGRAIPDFQLRYQPDAQGGMRFMMRMGPGRGRGPYEKQPFHAEDGTFVLEDVPAGRWMVEAFAAGYQSGSASGVTVGEGEAAEGVEVRLSKGGAITGKVLESRTGRPILDAGVRAELSGGGPGMAMIRMGGEGGDNEASTDAEGRYEIAGLAPGTWTVTASHPDWSEATTSVEVKDAPAAADIRLGRGGSIAGTVLAGGRPVAGAQVALSPAGDSGFRPGAGFSGGDQSVLSDEGGRFRFDRLHPGRYTLGASLRDQSSAPVEAVLTGDDSQEVQIALSAGAVVRGNVTGLPEGRLAGIDVSAQGRDYFATTRTAAGGAFELTGVPEGMVTLNARVGDFFSGSRSSSASTTVTIAPGQSEAAAEIVFEQGFRVDGHVTRGGRPVADAVVMALPEAGDRTANSRTDESGGYALEGLGEGRYDFTANPLSGGAPIRRTVDLAGDTTVDLEAPPARLAGTVVEADSARPLGDVGVRVEDEGGGMRFMNMATTDSSGRFAFEDLEPKGYRVSFQKAAYQVETRELQAAEDSDVRVEMRRGEGIVLEARDGLFGTPLRGLFVRVLDGSGKAAFAGSVSLDSDGRGEVPALRPGAYALRAESSGYAPASLPSVSVPSSAVPVVLTPGGSLEIQVGPQTLALPQPTARLLGGDGQAYLWNVFTDDGKIRLSG